MHNPKHENKWNKFWKITQKDKVEINKNSEYKLLKMQQEGRQNIKMFFLQNWCAF